MTTPLKVGDKAPDFSLPATGGTTIRLYDTLKQGPVLLLFYPLDWSPVCTQELCGIRDGFKEFKGLGIQVLGISVDSIFSHAAFAEKYSIAFPLLSDFNREVCTQYGVKHEEILGLKGIAKRSVFIIDTSGSIQFMWVSDDPSVMPDMDEIKRHIKALR